MSTTKSAFEQTVAEALGATPKEAPAVAAAVKKSRRYFEIFEGPDNKHYWRAKDRNNHKITFTGQGHTQRSHAVRAIHQELEALGCECVAEIRVVSVESEPVTLKEGVAARSSTMTSKASMKKPVTPAAGVLEVKSVALKSKPKAKAKA